MTLARAEATSVARSPSTNEVLNVFKPSPLYTSTASLHDTSSPADAEDLGELMCVLPCMAREVSKRLGA